LPWAAGEYPVLLFHLTSTSVLTTNINLSI
jgi:hypothetical protein